MLKTMINGIPVPKEHAPRIIREISKVDVFSNKPPHDIDPALKHRLQQLVYGPPVAEESCQELIQGVQKSPEALSYFATLLAHRTGR
jgi:hypothetical protein